MSTSISPIEVMTIIPETELDFMAIQAFIDTADVFLTTCGVTDDSESALNEQLVLWMTAHLIVSTVERQAILEKAGSVEQRFANIYGRNLYSTSYGQMVVQLDVSGILRKLAAERKVIQITAVPTTQVESIRRE